MNKVLAGYRDGVSDFGTNYTVEFWGGEVAEVDLVDYMAHGAETLAKTTRGYTGVYTNDNPSSEEMERFLGDIQNTKLGTPLEMMNFVFLFRDVPRSWTHQLVRTRMASYVQESTRFYGKKGVYKVLAPKTSVVDHHINKYYFEGNVTAIQSYVNMMDEGIVSNEDARQVLPQSFLTNVFVGIDMKTLMGIHEVRWCCQAEPSTWIPVMRGIKKHIASIYGNDVAEILKAPIDRGQPCGFNASFDRPCTWKKR